MQFESLRSIYQLTILPYIDIPTNTPYMVEMSNDISFHLPDQTFGWYSSEESRLIIQEFNILFIWLCGALVIV